MARANQPDGAAATPPPEAQIAALQAENNRLRVALQACVRTNTELDVDAALDAILDASQEIFGADRCLVLIAGGHTTLRSVRVARGLSAEYQEHLRTGYLPVARLLEEQETVTVEDIRQAESGLHPSIRELMIRDGMRALAATRLRHADHTFGGLVLYFDHPRSLSPGDLDLLKLFGDQAGLALVHAQDYELVNQLRLVREKSEQRLQSILDRLDDIVLVWSPQMDVLVANRPARELLDHREGVECNFVRDLHLEADQCPVRQAFRTGQSVVDLEFALGDRVFDVDCHPLIEPSTGEVVAVVQQARDVTTSHNLRRELAQNEAYLRRAMETAPVGMALLGGVDRRIRQANQMMAELCGAPIEELAGSPFVALLAPDDQPLFDEFCREAERRGRVSWEKAEVVSRTGPVPVTMMLGWLQIGDGEPTLQVVVKDIRNRLKLQNQLVEQEKLAAIGQLASGVAHELRNPIGIIASAIFDLEEILHPDDPDVIEDLKIARDEISRVQEIINNVLDFARSGTLDREWIDLGELLRQTVQLLRKSMATRDIEVSVTGDRIPEVWANRSAMRQVALNLITNSYHATPDGGTIRIELARIDEEIVQITVTDTGHGIPKDVLPRIFNPFFTTKGPGRGTGLGLSIVYSTIREHGGDIEVESEVGQGTTFRLTLPRRAPASQRRERTNPLIVAADELV